MYADVNEKLGRSWWDYGACVAALGHLRVHSRSSHSELRPQSEYRTQLTADNLVVTWGVQDNYEIVRKVGRGKYSEVSMLKVLF